MDKLKILFQQTLMISTGILFIFGVGGFVSYLRGNCTVFKWYDPFVIIFTGILCSIPTLLLYIEEEEISRTRFRLRVFFHCLILLAIVSVMGWIFRWYSGGIEYLTVAASYFAIYIFVWVATIWIQKTNENKINRALQNIQDKE